MKKAIVIIAALLLVTATAIVADYDNGVTSTEDATVIILKRSAPATISPATTIVTYCYNGTVTELEAVSGTYNLVYDNDYVHFKAQKEIVYNGVIYSFSHWNVNGNAVNCYCVKFKLPNADTTVEPVYTTSENYVAPCR